MSDRVYVDTDFLIAFLREEDRLHGQAKKMNERYGGALVATPYVFLELALIATDWIDNILSVFADVLEIVSCTCEEETVLRAGFYMDSLSMTAFDAFHCASADGERIISSDEDFDDTNVERIKL